MRPRGESSQELAEIVVPKLYIEQRPAADWTVMVEGDQCASGLYDMQAHAQWVRSGGSDFAQAWLQKEDRTVGWALHHALRWTVPQPSA
jgi:hypothetical protein